MSSILLGRRGEIKLTHCVFSDTVTEEGRIEAKRKGKEREEEREAEEDSV